MAAVDDDEVEVDVVGESVAPLEVYYCKGTLADIYSCY